MYNLNTDRDQYFYLGKVIKTHSFRGELVFLIESDNPDSYQDIEVVFMDIEGSLVPWFVENIEINNDRAVVKLEDVVDIDYARSLVKKDLYLPIEKLQALSGTDFYFHEVTGFRVIDTEKGDIGVVEEILERQEQDLIRIMNEGHEILIPMADEIIKDIDRKKKLLHLETPPGLIDLYLP